MSTDTMTRGDARFIEAIQRLDTKTLRQLVTFMNAQTAPPKSIRPVDLCRIISACRKLSEEEWHATRLDIRRRGFNAVAGFIGQEPIEGATD